MNTKEPLTHEYLNKQFPSAFALVSRAIKLASEMITERGQSHETAGNSDVNIVDEVLDKLAHVPDNASKDEETE